jgi:amino acid adenylation domain-containing protein
VRETALEAYAHQDVPFEKLVDELQPERDLSRSPLFQVMFALQNVPEQSLRLPGLEAEVLSPDLESSKFDLSVIINAEHGRLNATLEYSTALFKRDTIDRLWKHWQNLLQGLVASPETPLADLRMIDATERREILYDWNQTNRSYPQEKNIIELFEQRALITPSAVALRFEKETLTYAELNGRANQLARLLHANGVGPEQVIGICMERSVEMVVSLLAVLKAGAAYVPLDPGLPADRLEYMIADAKARMVLAHSPLLPSVPPHGAEAIAIDDKWPQISSYSDANVETQLCEENLAYVIYTSGSTGLPKGAMNEQHAIQNRLMWMQDAYQLTGDDRILQKTPYSFDVSVWEFFWPLLAGAQLILARPGGHQDSAYLVKLIREQGVTTIHFVPSMLQAFIEEPGIEKCLSLRRVICSGEALGWELQQAFHRRLPWAELHNLYGPTEAAVDVTSWHCEPAGGHPGVVPLGKPIANTQIHILDDDLEPVPIGVTGEIHIGGEAVGRGYWNNPDLTAQKFVPNPFSGRAGQRLYKTGDLGRYRADGVIEYLGRNDSQVKLRGFRIELGEIESALRRHPVVHQATVLAREDVPGQKRLVAYILPQQAAAMPSRNDEFESFLRDRLPEYMIPSDFVLLEQLPLTPSGKIDRRALPRPELRIGKERVAPRTSTEQGLAAIWEEVLGLEEVGIDDNFFNVGGDSIRSIQVRARAQQAGWNFSLQDMFRYQTIRQLAEHVGTEETEEIPETAPFSLVTEEDRQKVPGDVVDAYPLATLQMGMLFHQEFAPERAMYHNTLSFHVRARWDHQKFEHAVQAVVQRHPALRTSFDLDGYSVPLQLVHRDVFLPVPETDLRGMSPDEQEQFAAALVEQEKLRPFDLARPPQIWFQVHRRTDDTFQFTLTENHAMFDGWSLNSILAEVLEHYFALLKNEEGPVVPEPRSTYRDFVCLERQAIESEQHRNFWLEKLTDAQPTTLDAFTVGRALEKEGEIRFRPVLFALELSQRLQSVARMLGVHVKSVLLAAHLKVLSLVTGNTDVLTGMVSHGRIGQVDGERVKGLFLNTLPLRLSIRQDTWKDLIENTFAEQQEVFPYRRYPLHLIKKELGSLPFDCLFDFVHFHVLDKTVGSGDMEVLGVKKYEATSFKLFANFHQTVATPEVELNIGYDSGVFSEKQIQIIEGYYRKVIDAIASNPMALQDDELLLDNEEQRLAIESWNCNPPQHRGPFVHQLFEQQVAKTPETLAIDSATLKLSYRELDIQANAVAHALASTGAGSGDAVIIFTEDRAAIIPAVIGTLKVGCAFVPLLPQLPDRRLEALLAASAAKFAIVPEHLSSRMQELARGSGQKIRLIAAEQIRACPAQAQRFQASASHATADDLSYIFFTSGSTGQPKAIAGRLGAIDHFIRWEIETFGIGPGTRVSQLISPMFDAVMRDIFVPLCAGGTICIPGDQEFGVDAGALGRWLADQRINLVHLVPSLFRLMLSQLDQEMRLDSLRHVLLSGERLLPSDVSSWYGRGERGQLVNLYGPSETTMTKFWYPVSQEDASKHSIPVGKPMHGAAALVLNNAQRVCIPGSAGEICIRTPYRSHGYHLRPDLMVESFVLNPYGKATDDLVYRTGDIGRVLEDGNYELVGRRDQQIKVHGIRIEPGEIEAVLSACECISQAAVVDRQDSEGNTYLCAYLVPAGSLELDEIRRHVATQLPEYMAPVMYVQIERLPMLPNGKIDRRALPLPEQASVVKRHTFVEPRTVVEQVIAAMWQEILQVEKVGVLDNFFELGGHSLLITQLISRTRAVFRIEIPLRNFFDLEQATLENFARLVVSRERRPGEVEQIASVMSKISGLSESELEEVVKGQGAAS